MSDREEESSRHGRGGSRAESMSEGSDSERKVSGGGGYRQQRSKERSVSRSPTSEHKTKRKYSRSRSGSGSRHRKSSKRTGKYRSRSRTPKKYRSSRYSRSLSPRSDSYSPPPSSYHHHYPHHHHHRSSRRRSPGSRSPMSNRKRHNGNRENPEPNKCLGVFGLSIYTTEQQIESIFGKYGPVKSVQVVIDAKTGHSRGFCFVYFENLEDARLAKEECTGMEIDGRKIRVDYSITHRPHTPTPGIYMGKPTYNDGRYYRGRDRYEGDYYYSGYRGGYSGGGGRYRSPSPYYISRSGRHRSGYERSRSRSYSPITTNFCPM